ncbi:MAG: hypothetical protein K0R18_224 [Bacillales bacterium]|jgi:hypothetical protein|nr:hypothetical protein [Bacillales bacterium]
MEPWEKAIEEVSQYSENYSVIDTYIKPLCELLTENGFITLHSCSAHIKASTSNIRRSLYSGKWIIEKDRFKKTTISKRWYIMFVPRWPIEEIENIVKSINDKYDYKIELEQTNDFEDLTNRWVIDEFMEFNFNDKQLQERHKNIYIEFKDHFELKAKEVI